MEKLKELNDWGSLSREEKDIMLDIKRNGPDCAKFLSRKNKMPLEMAMNTLKKLESEAWLKRVRGTFLEKKGMRRPKHMNHTYFDISRTGNILMRKLLRTGKIEQP
jgi:predicted transcriptional regulator